MLKPLRLNQTPRSKPPESNRATVKLQIETIQIHNNFQNPQTQQLFDQLLFVWEENNIPEIHRKYYYNVLLNTNKQDQLMMREIEAIREGDCAIQLLEKLTIGRERCLKEINRCIAKHHTDVMGFVRLMSKYIYDLRRLSLALVQQYIRWNHHMAVLYLYTYQWTYEGHNYLLKMKEDHKIFAKHPIISRYFHFSSGDDIFYQQIVTQSYQADIEYDDHLAIHRLSERHVLQSKEYETYLAGQYTANAFFEIVEQFMNTLTKFVVPKSTKPVIAAKPDMQIPPAPLSNRILESSIGDGEFKSPGPSRALSSVEVAIEPLPEYDDQILYHKDNISFIVKVWPVKDIPKILKYWRHFSIDDYKQSFLTTDQIISDQLTFGCESALLQIGDYGLMLVSVEQDCAVRRWVVHFILSKQDRFAQILEHFNRMLVKMGDKYSEIKINLLHYGTDKLVECKSFQIALKEAKYKFRIIAHDSVNNVRYTSYILKVPKSDTNPNRPYYEPIVFQAARIFSEKYTPKFYCDEELLEAQYCCNLGEKCNLIEFDEVTKFIAKTIQKQKIHGQSYKVMADLAQVQLLVPEFQSPVTTSVHFQLFTQQLNFQYYSIEQSQDHKQAYMRLINCNLDGEPSILEVVSQDAKNKRKLFLVSTSDPYIKIFIFEVQKQEVNPVVSNLVNSIFENYVEEKEMTANIWLPLFEGKGHRYNLTDTVLASYFQSETKFSLKCQQSKLKSIHNLVGNDKIIHYPFLIGIVQQDIEQINKPIFSFLVQEENIVHSIADMPLARMLSGQVELNMLQFAHKEIDNTVNTMLNFACLDMLNTFDHDHEHLTTILKYYESCVVQLLYQQIHVGFAVLKIDPFHNRRWVIELISVKTLDHFNIMMNHIVGFIYNNDLTCVEIYITQNYQEHDGQFTCNKTVTEGLKKAGFRWKQQSHDAKSGRKTIYSSKRTAQSPPVVHCVMPLQFRCYYAIQQSPLRNTKEQQLQYFKNQKYLQISEDYFHNRMESDLSDDVFLKDRMITGKQIYPGNKYQTVKTSEELDQIYIDLPNALPIMAEHHDKIYCNFTNIQLKWIQARPVTIESKEYIELPIDPNENIVMTTNKEFKHNIYLVNTLDPYYKLFFTEIKPDEVSIVEKDLLKYTTSIMQHTEDKKVVQWDICLPMFEFNDTRSSGANWMQMNFSTVYHQTIPQRLIKQLNNRVKIIKLPILVGLVHEEVVEKYERPIFSIVITKYKEL